ncbi:MAG TPA: hypothetical protein VHP33_18005 [Polyangiaceae bacterium]|nr:hypothetical protein [Polyangiaceae bacterium]
MGKVAQKTPFESQKILATIPRGTAGEIRITWCKLHTGASYVDIRYWKASWRGPVPQKQGIPLDVKELEPLANALLAVKL